MFSGKQGYIILIQLGGWGVPSACTLIEETRRALLPHYRDRTSVRSAFVFLPYVASVGEEASAWRMDPQSADSLRCTCIPPWRILGTGVSPVYNLTSGTTRARSS